MEVDEIVEEAGDMAENIATKLFDRMTGRNSREKVRVSLNEMVDMLDRLFIQPASREEYITIWKTIKGSWWTGKKLESKDGNYEISVWTHRHTGAFNLKDRNFMWIWDKNADRNYEYRAYSWRKLKKAVRRKLDF